MPEATTNGGGGGGFLDYFRTAGDVFGSVYGSLNPADQPARPRPAAAAPAQQNNLLMYGLIGGGVLLLLIVILGMRR